MRAKNRGSFLGWCLVGAAALGGAAVACGSSNFSATDGDAGTLDATLDDGSSGGTETGSSSGGPDGGEEDSSRPPHSDGGADATTQPDATTPPLDDAGDAGCATVPDDTTGAIVSLAGSGTAATGCTLATPCAKIQDGINYAASRGYQTIYVDQGTYAEAITLSNTTNVMRTLQGGWKRDATGTWARDCTAKAPSLVTIKPPGTPGLDTTVTAKDLVGPFTLQEVLLESRTGAVAAGESFYGVFASGPTTRLTLYEVSITVASGGAGADGNQGTAGAGPLGTGACSPGAGGTPAAGGNGTPGPNGSYGPSGFTPTGGGAANAGGAGGNGAVNGAKQPDCSTQCYDKGCGPPDCTAGSIANLCAGDGPNGCGSGGSGGGTGGTGGGSSIGVYVTAGASVTGRYTNVATGAGGPGGAGGGGGTVSAPSPGGTGATAICSPQCGPLKNNKCQIYPGTPLAGGIGTGGATGSPGGVGGGGAGGDSYGYYTSGGTFIEDTAFNAVPGAAGTTKGANPGLPGRSAPHN
jgi:hypothetical protein